MGRWGDREMGRWGDGEIFIRPLAKINMKSKSIPFACMAFACMPCQNPRFMRLMQEVLSKGVQRSGDGAI
ncbi:MULTISPECIES: hypothetical protein [unclassified Moorena]|uniref:hypothetical protein n=1 Tax=unclassified Moorena TaxID=2683338 RepID=UPI001400026F|nr:MULTISPECIES: hypothetical protein [unclassified Moorena]NEO12907.1 hypothetical protein [Moorena sp. SIO3E8]NEP99923.1 hypothetical protein [Moorena sp. SIO3F7]